MKSPNGEDVIKSLYEDGLTMNKDIQYEQYKVIELRCGFNQKYDGYINPCQDIIDNNIPEYKPRLEEKQQNDYVPKRFYPTQPYDVNAGICNIALREGGGDEKLMLSEEGEAFEDNMIVEFRYDKDRDQSYFDPRVSILKNIPKWIYKVY